MMQDRPYAGFERIGPASSAAGPYAGFERVNPAAAPARPRPQRPAQSPQGQQTPAPVLNDLGITDEEELAALTAQYGSREKALEYQAQRMAADPNYDPAMAASQPAMQEPIAAPALENDGFPLPEGVVDWNRLTQPERQNLKRGARVMMPQNEGETFRQVVTLAADLGGPLREPVMGDQQLNFGDVRAIVPGPADAIGAFTSGALEQVPGADEAVTGLDALVNKQSFSESRDQYRNMVEALNNQQRGMRNAGGVSGFVGTMLIPGAGGAKYVAQGATRGAQIGRAIQTGAAGGAVYGAASEEGGAEDRARAAALGAALGGGTGGVIQGASPYIGEGIRRLGSGFSEAGSVVSRGFGRTAPEAPITPDATRRAEQYIAQLVESSGADLAANPVAAMGKPITSAEAIGPSGIANMAALARRSGRAGNMAQSQLGARAVEQPSRVVQDFADLTGMDPAGSADMIQNLATAGRARAAPLYEAAYSMQVQPTPLMENILARPVGQAALRRAYRIARNEGRNPDELGLFVTTRNEGRATGEGRISRDPELFNDLDALRAGSRTQGPGRGESLLSFISKNGGVRDDGGELAQIGADVWNRQGAWRSRAVRDDGLSLEQMADRARAAGYFPDVVDATADGADNYQRLSSQDMIDAIDAELRGTPRFAREIGDTNRSAAASARMQRRNALEERLNREGIDISKASNDDVARALRDADDAEARAMAFLDGDAPGEPQIELLPGEIPSMQTLDYVKRGLDDVISTYRDSTTRRLNLDEEGRSVLSAATKFREELVAATGGETGPYAQALSAGGDPIRLEEAFRLSDRLFQVGTPERTFAQATQRMGEAERNALVAGFADRLFRDAQAGRLSTRQLNQLNVPVTREKLASLIGAEGAESFMQRVGAEIELARSGGRMAPGTNSVTAEALAAMAEQDGSTGFGADLSRQIAQSPGNLLGALTMTAGKAAVAPISGFVRGMSVAQPQAVRDEMARLLLLSPGQLREALMAAADSSTPDAGALAKILRPAAGIGGGQAGAGFSQRDTPPARRASPRAAQ
jgi:hypothetical protein